MANFKRLLPYLVIFLLGIGLGYGLFINTKGSRVAETKEKNTSGAFLSESYDKIKDNFWDNLADAALIDLFKLSAEKNGAGPLSFKIEGKDKLITEILSAQNNLPNGQKEKFLPNVLGSVLASLNPPGRSGLYTQKQEEQLKNTVENINPEKDLYQDLGLAKGASESAVSDAYQKQAEELKKQNTTEAQEKLQKIAYAKDVLTSQDKKQRYDEKGVEPTIFSKVIGSSVLYIQFKKFSPASLDEFVKVFETHKDNTALTSLVFDLRGNIGGAIDASAYFLGYFIGKNQYAFDFYKKGEYLPFKTPTEKLPSVTKFKQMVVLVDNNTQSSAELMTVTFKKYHAGVVLGVPTKGWGTVERVFPLDNQINEQEKYSIFLVHAITLRDDNLPIEGRGVEPDINIKDPNWDQQLFSYFRNQQLINAVTSILQL